MLRMWIAQGGDFCGNAVTTAARAAPGHAKQSPSSRKALKAFLIRLKKGCRPRAAAPGDMRNIIAQILAMRGGGRGMPPSMGGGGIY
jgi:hypothetical protein